VSASKRPSTSSLRRFISSRPYVTVAELRRRFGLDDPDAMTLVRHNGTTAWLGLPEREAAKVQDLWIRNELGMELSVEVRAPVVVGVYPMRIARYVVEGNGSHPVPATNGRGGFSIAAPPPAHPATTRPDHRAPRPMPGAPSYGRANGTGRHS
jgi:hypothetical protein